MIFYPADICHFLSFDFHLGSQLGSLWQKCDPDRCDQNSYKSRLCFFSWPSLSILLPFRCSLEAHAARMEQQCEKLVSRKNLGPRNIMIFNSLKPSPNQSNSLPGGATVGASCQHTSANEIILKSLPPWAINPSSIFRGSGLFLGTTF